MTPPAEGHLTLEQFASELRLFLSLPESGPVPGQPPSELTAHRWYREYLQDDWASPWDWYLVFMRKQLDGGLGFRVAEPERIAV
jgi:hypothetical protein